MKYTAPIAAMALASSTCYATAEDIKDLNAPLISSVEVETTQSGALANQAWIVPALFIAGAALIIASRDDAAPQCNIC